MMSKKPIFAFIVFSFFIFPLFSFAQTTNLQALITELQKQVLELQKQIQDLKAELGQQIPQTSVSTESQTTESTQESIPDFTRTLSRGISGDDVRKLQEFLKKDKEIYPDGLITGYFGPKTEEALKKWQTKHNIEAVGILGPQTRARFSELGKGVIQGLLQQGAGASGVIPPGLITAPGIQKKLEVTATTTPLKPSPRPGTCEASNAYCINSDECSKGGYYWCRNSCYATSTACLGEAFVAPVVPAVSAVPAIPATPAVPVIVATSTIAGGDTIPPSTPTGLSAVPHAYSVVLSWNKSTDNVGVVGYKIYRKNGAYGLTTQIANINIYTSASTVLETITDREVSPLVFYSYTVVAYDAAFNDSSQSSPVSVTTLPAPSSIPQVQGLTVSLYNKITLLFTWQAIVDIGSYNIYQGTSSDFVPSFSNIIAVGVNSPHFQGVPLSPGTYYYKSMAVDRNGNLGPASSAVIYTHSTSDTTPPSMPTGLTATPAQYSITLSWNNSTDNIGVTGYKVYRDGTQVFSTTTYTSLATSSFTDWALTPSTSYSYTVAAYDASGNTSAQSSAVSATTVAVQTTIVTTTTTAAVSDLTATFYSNGFYVFSWKDNSGISSGASSNYYFYVYQKPQGGSPSLIFKQYNSATNFIYWYHPQGTYEYYVSLCNEITKSCVGTSNTVSVQVNVASSFPQCTGLILTTNKSIYIVNEIGKYTVSCVPSNGRAVNVTVRYTNPNGQLIRPSPLTNIQKSTTDFGIHSVGNYIFEACLHPECQPSPEASLSVSAVAATTTSSINSDTASRLAQILESLNSILNSLKLLR